MTAQDTAEIVWLEAPDGVRMRAAHWPGPRGTVLLLSGRGEYVERYSETVQVLQDRGFGVWTWDWRGQGRSTRGLPDPLKHHVLDFGHYLDDAELILDRHVVPRLGGQPLLMLAHSMGGHLGLRLLARRPELFARAAISAPMIDFLGGGIAVRAFARAVFRAGCLLGKTEHFGPGTPARPNLNPTFEGNPLTSCPERFAASAALLRSMPDVHLGGATWGWLRAATQSQAALQREVKRITMPTLVAIAGADRLVDSRTIRAFVRRLPQGRALELPGARHELLREHDRHRLPLWAEIDRFLLGIPRPP
jgi:lysophospholipase